MSPRCLLPPLQPANQMHQGISIVTRPTPIVFSIAGDPFCSPSVHLTPPPTHSASQGSPWHSFKKHKRLHWARRWRRMGARESAFILPVSPQIFPRINQATVDNNHLLLSKKKKGGGNDPAPTEIYERPGLLGTVAKF